MMKHNQSSNQIKVTRSPKLWVPIAAALLGLGLGALLTVVSAQANETHAQVHQTKFPIPNAIRAEHAEIHQQLVAATRAKGEVGEAARKLAAILDPHFQREEQIALPPLALLAPLSRHEFNPGMRDVLAMTDALRAELPHMLEEHKAIHAATTRMETVARKASNAEVQRLAEMLKLHAESEEEVFYPAAILVGDVVRAHFGSKGTQP